MENEFFDIGSLRALLNDARERIKESENRSNKKIDESENRIIRKFDELEEQFNNLNIRIVQWLPLLSNLSKTEENKRNVTISLIIAFVCNISAWILTAFVYFIKTSAK